MDGSNTSLAFTRWQQYCALLISLLLLGAVRADLDAQRRHEEQDKDAIRRHQSTILRRYSQFHHDTSSSISSSSNDDADNDVETQFMEQPLDHFRLADGRTFQQRYFVSHRHVRAEAAVTYAFLCVGGEGPALEETVLIDSVHCTGDMLELAAKMEQQNKDDENAATISIYLYALEHRYYGKSYPVFSSSSNNSTTTARANLRRQQQQLEEESPVSNQNLVYLSSRQALADLANFVAARDTEHPTTNTKWITFGGSYPGMMAAWARLRFPHLITAAVASSAPIQPRLDFCDYNNHVGTVLQMTPVGGSDLCYEIVRRGHAALSQMFHKNQSWQTYGVARDFQICEPKTVFEDAKNVAQFLGDGVIQLGTQGNDPSCTEPLCNIAKRCEALIHHVRDEGLPPSEGLRLLAMEQRRLDNETECTDMSWNHTLEYLADPHKAQAGGLRSWLWQTCTEFGFYQTCHVNSTCPFAQGWHGVEQDLEICETAFGVAPAQVKRAIQDTYHYYGGWQLAASRILSVNGNVDPWSELALQNSSNKLLPTLSVPGASHHFWTHASKETDSAAVVAARNVIHETVMKWLRQDEDEEQRFDDEDLKNNPVAAER